MIEIRQEGDFSKLSTFFEQCKEAVKLGDLDRYGRAGVDALRSATPRDTGLTANSWTYKIVRKQDSVSLVFENSNMTDEGTPIVVLLQYGHNTPSGTYVEGVDFINPALTPIFNKLAEDAWREVNK